MVLDRNTWCYVIKIFALRKVTSSFNCLLKIIFRLVCWCCIVTHVDSHLHICTYICRIIHSDTTIKTQEGRRRKTSLTTYLPLNLLQELERVVQGFACERMLETEHKLHILTPLLWLSRCVFLVLLMLGSTPSGGFPRTPSVGCGFPYHIWSLGVWNSTGNCFGTQLNSII